MTEVADRVWVKRCEWFDVNLCVIGGERGLVVVDTHASSAAGQRWYDEVRALGDVVAVVNTHWHFDHTFGNSAFAGLPIHAHEKAVEELRDGAAAVLEEHGDELVGTEIVLPTDTFSSARIIDLGDRSVELLHPGRAHTSGDLVVNVPDAQVLIAGDLVEESAPPSYGDDSWPLEWPLALDMVLSLSSSATQIVPGHGAVVDRDYVEQQRADIGIVAETIRDLAGRGVPVSQALEVGEWPLPKESLTHAVERGYAHLPRSQKRLPLI